MKYDIRQAAQALISQLKAIDYERLPISKYNKRYIARLKPVLSYYMKIYADCLLKGLESIGSSPEEITLIDYGGGSGFLSILAKPESAESSTSTSIRILSIRSAS